MRNPFVTKGYAGPEYFCDREKETENIISLITNENNIALISPRRLGKTELICHCFNQPVIKDNYYTFLVDVYATSSVNDFVFTLGKAIIDELRPRGRKVWEKFLSGLKSLQSEISFDINGNPVWGIGMGKPDNPETTLDEIFQYLNDADRPCIVAIDEFQQICKYPEGSKLEAMLRTHMQKCLNATFIFSGSKRHLMGEIFTSPSRPFYQSVMTMGLAPIPEEKYIDFAVSLFARHGKKIEQSAVSKVYRQFKGVTSCLQRVMNVMFLKTGKGEICKEGSVDDSVGYILDMFSENYATLLSQMPERQRNILMAFAKEHEASNISSGAFIKKYKLNSPSSVMSAVKGLMEKDFVTQENGIYTIYDPFLERWLMREGV